MTMKGRKGIRMKQNKSGQYVIKVECAHWCLDFIDINIQLNKSLIQIEAKDFHLTFEVLTYTIFLFSIK